MPTVQELVAAGLGTAAQKKADEKRRRQGRREAGGGPSRSAQVEQPSRVVGTGPGESGPDAAELHTSNDLEISKLRKEVDALKDASEDLYTKIAERDAKIELLEKEHEHTKELLRNKRQEVGGINENLFASERALKQVEEALEKEQAAHKKTKSERDQNNAQKQDYVSLSKSQDVAIKAEAERRDELRRDLDDVTTDYQFAQSRIDDLEERLAKQTCEAEEAHNYLNIIHEALDKQFDEDNVELTPDTFALHMSHLSGLATNNRHASGTSNTSSQHDGAHHSSRPSTGQRKVSMAQELANVNEYDESSDEDRSSTSNDLKVNKRRSQSEGDGVVSTSSSNAEEKEQKIQAQVEQIEKLKAEHQCEVEKLRDQLGARQKEVNDLKDDIAMKETYLEKSAEALERVRDERVRAANGYSVQQNNLTHDQVTKHDATTQTLAVEILEPKAEEQPAAITKPASPADLWEAFKQSPFWLQFLVGLCSLLLVFFGFSGWLKLYAAYGAPIDKFRQNQAKFAFIGFWSQLEDLIGYDSRLLG